MKQYRIAKKTKLKLKRFSPDYPGNYLTDKKVLKEETQKLSVHIADWQPKLYAEAKQSLLVVLQAMDTGGKDSTIASIFSWVNPQGCRVHSFKKPTELELSHHFLWRIWQNVPPNGYITVFNRSHYEDVLVPRVQGAVSDKLARQRFEEIRDFEKNLSDQGTRILKFFLHISKEEQKKRLQERLDNPKKNWKFNPEDLKDRRKWNRYMRYYEEAIGATGTREAPWFVIPANHKWFRNWIVAQIILEALEAMNPRFPRPAKGFHPKKIKIP